MPDPGPPLRLRLLGAPTLLTSPPIALGSERRCRLAAYLALQPDGVSRDEAATLFWPERDQAAARSNLRKLIAELRRLALPGIELDGERLRWPVGSDALDLLGGGPSEGESWALPMQGLDGGDSPAYDVWLSAMRERLRQVWRDTRLDPDGTRPPAAALAAARALLDDDPSDSAALAQAQRSLRALGRADDARRLPDELRHEPRSDADAPTGTGEDPDLIGRTGELQESMALLGERTCRLLTLTGPGGVGKSTLALALLRQAAAVDATSAHWIALADLDHGDAVLPRVARELGVVVGPSSDGWPEVRSRLEGQAALLLFDNAEHLAGLGDLVRRLLAALPLLRCVVTSRTRLSVPGEWLLPVGPLEPDAARRLFLSGARAAPSRRPIAADEPALDELLAVLGHLPLALRMAAAWTRHLPLPALLHEARRACDMLELDATVDDHPAHRSLRATFERSWQLLPPALRPALAALSVCVGTVRLETAQHIGAVSPAQLAALADASLIDIGADGRLGMHPLLRQFARERLASSGGEEEALRRHAAAFADLMAPWKEFDDVDNAAALRDIAPDIGNVALAWRSALQVDEPRWLEALASALSNHQQAHGGLLPVQSLFAQAERQLAVARPCPHTALCGVALEHGALSFWLGEYEAVERSMRLALRAARAARLARPMRKALNGLAVTAMRQGRPQEGAVWLARALELARRDGAERDVVIYSGNLSGVVRELGELDRAESLAREALAGHQRFGHAVGEVSVLGELALIAHQRDQLEEACARCDQALGVVERHAMALRRPVFLTLQASVRLDQGRLDEALVLALASHAEVQRVGARSHEPMQRRVLAEILHGLGRHADAAAQLRLALAIVEADFGTVAARGICWSGAVFAAARGDTDLTRLLIQHAEAERPPGAGPLPRYQRLRDALPVSADAGHEGDPASIPGPLLLARLRALLA